MLCSEGRSFVSVQQSSGVWTGPPAHYRLYAHMPEWMACLQTCPLSYIHTEAEACIVIMNDKSASMTAIVQMASKPLITIYFFIMYF